MKKWFGKWWNDPVGSKVIGGLITAATIGVAGILWQGLTKQFSQVTGILFVFFVVAFGFMLWYILEQLIFYLIQLRKSRKSKNDNNDGLRINPVDTIEFLRIRMTKSFHGKMGIQVFNNSITGVKRLSLLLQQPLTFKEGNMSSQPIWWFRCGDSEHIDSFSRIGLRSVRINFMKMRVKKVAAYRSYKPYQNFIYIEVKPSKPTKYFPKSELTNEDDEIGEFVYEEYGVYKILGFIRKKVSFQELQDGATTIFGRTIYPYMQPRIRILKPFNFLITSFQSPINSSDFDQDSEEVLNGILSGSHELGDLVNMVNKFRPYDILKG